MQRYVSDASLMLFIFGADYVLEENDGCLTSLIKA